jgi:NADP-dependent aldehyde dehydrogenase
MTTSNQIVSVDARTNLPYANVTQATSAAEVHEIVVRAAAASSQLAAAPRSRRAELLRAMAAGLEGEAEAIVETADRETALGVQRLRGELARTCFQLRLFGEVLDEGSYLEATIDHADPTARPVARPDLRRILVPIGPIAVFAASNFPLAFSVPGGDTASALAAGNSVVVKAHSGHPATSMLCANVLRRVAEETGWLADIVTVVYGTQAGRDLVQHPLIAAAGFTGSVTGGRALFDLANARPTPIPFYGELGSLNAFVVTPDALRDRAQEIVEGLRGSFTLGMGQFCTKPGLVFVPSDAAGEFVRKLSAEAASVPAAAMLNRRILDGWRSSVSRLAGTPGVAVTRTLGTDEDMLAIPTVIAIDGDTIIEQGPSSLTLEECFGPSTLVVSYREAADLAALLELVPGSLTGTVHAGTDGEHDAIASLAFSILTRRTGRVIWNEYPTGVAVTWAQQHGGPYPAATVASSTSVGAAAIARFLRPVAFQNVPERLLPSELRDDNTAGVPRRVDGIRGTV